MSNNGVGSMLLSAHKKSNGFDFRGIDATVAKDAIRKAIGLRSLFCNAAVDCIKEANSIEECASFAEIMPSPYVSLMAAVRIREILSMESKSTLSGGHENNE